MTHAPFDELVAAYAQAYQVPEAEIHKFEEEFRPMAERQVRRDMVVDRIAERETQVKELEAQMAAPDFYSDPAASRAVIDRHQALMWEVGDLMGQWESLQEHASEQALES